MTTPSSAALNEVNSGKRFAFGNNWEQFLSCISEERIDEAVNSLTTMLEVTDLKGKLLLI